MKEWVDHRLQMIHERIEAEKARIQACEENGTRTIQVIPAFGGKTGMLRSVALYHFHSRFSERLTSEDCGQGILETEAFRTRAEELIGKDLMKVL